MLPARDSEGICVAYRCVEFRNTVTALAQPDVDLVEHRGGRKAPDLIEHRSNTKAADPKPVAHESLQTVGSLAGLDDSI